MKKKFVISALALTFITSTVALAQQPVTVTIDGQPVQFQGQQPTIIDGRTLVPVRGVFEELGFEVGWEGTTRQVTLTRPTHTVNLTIDQATFTTNQANHQLDVPAQIINDSTMLPLRAVVESVGYTLDWDGSTQTVLITRPTPQEDQPTINPISITRNGIEKARADETGVHILARVLLTQEEIQSLIPHARLVEETRMSPHPDRAMTQQELVAWNQEYDSLGGMNVFELEVLYLINNIRIEHNLVPFILCPYLNRASRLHTNLLSEGHWGPTRHYDPFYGSNDPVHGQPARGRAFLFDSTLTDRPRSFIGENSGSSAPRAESAVNGWMNSPPHRGQILEERWEDAHIGVGRTTDGGPTTKFNGQQFPRNRG